jgi:hypothetical protein
MAPAWNKLMDEFAGDPVRLIADVDCTSAGKPLCEQFGVKGYPSIKFGDPADMEDYKGGRDFDALKKFADEKLKPTCSPANIDLCDEEKKKAIEKFMNLPAGDLQAEIDAKSAEMEKAEADFKAGVEGLQKQYEALQEAKDATLEEIKEAGLGLMKAVSKHAAKTAKDEL